MAKAEAHIRETIGTILDRVMLPYQRADVVSEDRFRWNNWSRQTGKSFAKSFRRLIRGIARKRNQLFLSAGERQSRELMLKAQQHCRSLKIAFDLDERTAGTFEGVEYKALAIHLPAMGIRIIGLPANPSTARGFTGDVFCDEFAMHEHDREIWAAMFPTVLRGAGELDIASTPHGRSNLFYALRTNDAFGHQTVTIHDAVADGLDVEVETLRKAFGDDLLWRQEFECEFLDESTAFLTFEQIIACEDDTLRRDVDTEALRECRDDLYLGIDVARRGDLTVLWPFRQVGRELVSMGLIELRDVPFRGQIELAASLLRMPRMRRCAIDASGLGMQMAEDLARECGAYRVEPVTFTAAIKEQMAGAMRVKFEDRTIRIPPCEKIRNDLHSVERTVTIAGNVRLYAPREAGSHADRFWAAALAVHAAGTDAGPVEASFGPDVSERSTAGGDDDLFRHHPDNPAGPRQWFEDLDGERG